MKFRVWISRYMIYYHFYSLMLNFLKIFCIYRLIQLHPRESKHIRKAIILNLLPKKLMTTMRIKSETASLETHTQKNNKKAWSEINCRLTDNTNGIHNQQKTDINWKRGKPKTFYIDKWWNGFTKSSMRQIAKLAESHINHWWKPKIAMKLNLTKWIEESLVTKRHHQPKGHAPPISG